ncbi:diguanylate cyclase [Acetobacterium fimetarium]|jgi:PAS domain S-box/diguanylate cyclase (GGDEF) domain/uncharacterized domain HDIG|uniref:Stage 0 sporulation protein A homolog n=1 Tax=Acetobacterium fimetarium TaxID=52691 RepID=A0ABR6WS62_9FIRM|nr:HD domain-containing protein [Acetobacterium fimetarium]MBC3803370.1 diguanylate cyclase [Acetobacterium fimetarium]
MNAVTGRVNCSKVKPSRGENLQKIQVKILVIDEDQENAMEIEATILSVFPECLVFIASDGKTGSQVAKMEKPDMILWDIIKPELYGFEMCRQLKADENLVDIPLVFISSYRLNEEQQVLALECGGTGFIMKPIDEYVLGSQIRAMKKIKNDNVKKRNELERLDTLIKKQDQVLKLAQEQSIQLFRSLEKEYRVRKKSQKALLEAQRLASLGNYEFSQSFEEVSCSNEVLKILGVETIQEVSCIENLTSLIHPEDRTKVLENIKKTKNTESIVDLDFRILKPDGEERIVNARICPRFDQTKGYVVNFGTIQDITKIKRKEEEIRYISYHDYLTGLYNRRYFEDMLKNLDQEKNYPLTLIMADVNGLKIINDSFGHAVGDELLKKISDIFKNNCREDDVVARLGGDEFIFILPRTDKETAALLIKRMETLAANEKIRGINLSIAFGSYTKKTKDESNQRIIEKAEDEMYRNKLYERASTRNITVELIMNILYEKSSREMIHSMRVALICEKIGLYFRMNKEEINMIRTAGLIHDIGKIGIDENILNKPEKLNDDEWDKIRKHPEIGYRILNSVSDFSEMADCIQEHHERWDGKGYPKGLKGEEISLQGRIVAIADCFDAMTSDRPYRKGISMEEAITELKKNSGTQFDPIVTRVFVEKVMRTEF